MIVAEQKPLEDIIRMVRPYKKVLLLGCGTCTTVCNAGGETEVAFLHDALRMAEARAADGRREYSEATLKRQCDPEFLEHLTERVEGVDAVVSLACGTGVQALAERFADLPVFPGVNTSFIGMAVEWGVWDERCAACGDCRLEDTGGICPITRCTKGILNGPCAGPKNGHCEVSPDMECAWLLIYRRLERLGQLERMRRYYPPRNFRPISRPRRIVGKAGLEARGSHGDVTA